MNCVEDLTNFSSLYFILLSSPFVIIRIMIRGARSAEGVVTWFVLINIRMVVQIITSGAMVLFIVIIISISTNCVVQIVLMQVLVLIVIVIIYCTHFIEFGVVRGYVIGVNCGVIGGSVRGEGIWDFFRWVQEIREGVWIFLWWWFFNVGREKGIDRICRGAGILIESRGKNIWKNDKITSNKNTFLLKFDVLL